MGAADATETKQKPLLVEVTTGSVVVEGDVRSRLPEGTTFVARPNVAELIEADPGRLAELMDQVSGAVMQGLQEARPDDLTIEFGISFKGSAGIPAIASGEGSTNLKVTMVWRHNGTK